MDEMKYYQQGDVLIIKTKIPSWAAKIQGNILAYGEATGHAHKIDAVKGFSLHKYAGDLYLEVTARSVSLVHDEHLPIKIPKGGYKIEKVREFDHYQKKERFVAD